MRQFAATQTFGGLAPAFRQNDLALGSQLNERRKHGAKDFANGRDVVAGNPGGEFDELRGERRDDIEHAGDFTDFSVFGSGVGQLHDNANQRLLAEGHQDPGARPQRIAQLFRHGIGERRSQGHGQRHVAERRIHRAV